MKRTLLGLTLVLALLVPVVPAGAATAGGPCPNADLPVAEGNLPQVRAAMLCLVNNERVPRGLGVLGVSPELDLAAQRHAEDMTARGYLSHDAPAPAPFGVTPNERAQAAGYRLPGSVVENLAAGTRTAREALEGLMEDTGHCRSLVDGNNTELGVGAMVGADGVRFALELGTTRPSKVSAATVAAQRGCPYKGLLTPDAAGNLAPGAGTPGNDPSQSGIRPVGSPGLGTPTLSVTLIKPLGGERMKVTGIVQPAGVMKKVRVTFTSPKTPSRSSVATLTKTGTFSATLQRVPLRPKFTIGLRSIGFPVLVTGSRTINLQR